MNNTAKYRTRLLAIFSVVLAAVLLSLNGIFVKNVYWVPIGVAVGRAFFAGLTQLAVVRRLKFSFSRWQIAASISIAVSITAFVGALLFTTVINAYALFYSIPVFLVIFSYFFAGEEPNGKDLLVVLTIVAGCFLIFRDSFDSGGSIGDLLAIVSAAGWALGSLLIRKERGLSSDETSILANALIVIVLLPFVDQLPDVSSIGWLFLCGAIGTGLPMLLFGRATKYLRSIETNLIAVLDLVLAPVWAFLFLKEVPSANVIVGACIIFSSVAFHAYLTARHQDE